VKKCFSIIVFLKKELIEEGNTYPSCGENDMIVRSDNSASLCRGKPRDNSQNAQEYLSAGFDAIG